MESSRANPFGYWRLGAGLSLLFVIGFFSAVAQEHRSGPPATSPATLPAAAAFTQWLGLQRSAGVRSFADPQELAAGLQLAQSRATELRALLAQDPEQFLRQALPEAERSAMPASLQPFIERRIKQRGSFGVFCGGLPETESPGSGHAHPHPGYGYEVRLDGISYQAFVFGKWRNQKSVRDAEIAGVVLDDAIAIGDSPTPDEQAAGGSPVTADAPTTTGPNTLLYMIARFSDQVSDPVTDATALSQMGVVSNFWVNNSSGVVSLRGLANPAQVMDIVHIVLPHPAYYATNYNANFGSLISDARSAASAQGFNYANYNLDLVVTTGSGFGYAGRAYIGSQGAHCVAGYTSLRTSGHELGHNLGLYHAQYWRTDATRPFGRDTVPGGYVADTSNTEWIEYGHYFSVMSAQSGGEMDDATKPHYTAAEKVDLGWLSGAEVQYASSSGSFRLYRHDARATTGTPRAIRIETPATDYTGYGRRYWLNYRYAPWSVGQSWLRTGLQIDICQSSYGSDGAIQLDMTPFSYDASSGASYTSDNTDKRDGALIVGRTYSDTGAGIHITPTANGNFGTDEEYIDVVVNLGAFPGNRPPVISAFTISTNQIPANQSVNFAVSATDPDGDSLAYAWDFDQVQTWTQSGLNSSAATKSWPSAGQYRVTVTASDLKGGVASESQIITVGAPASNRQIWGRVLWGGTPVYGARVWSTAGSTVFQAWTDSDGTYVLTDLASTNSYLVKCQRDGLTFTAQFGNPVSLPDADAFGKDFYANETLPGGGGANAFVVSGQVTDAGGGVSGAEVRAGGKVVTTDTGGNYQFTNFPPGTYTISPRKDAWTFSPESRVVSVTSANSTGNNFSRVAPYSISGRIDGPSAGGNNPAPTVYLSTGRSVPANSAGSGPNKYWAYTLNNVPAGQYSLSAGLSGYRITPSGFSNPLTVAGNLTGINFSGSVGTVAGAVSGRITRLGTPLAGVTVQVKSGSTVIAAELTDSDGYYRAANLTNAAYTILPTLSGYSFSPASLNIGSVPASGQNFTATGGGSAPSISSVTATPAVVPSGVNATTLAAIATGSGTLTYAWDALSAPAPVTFSVNDSSSAASTSAGFQSPGSYTFRVRVTGTNGLSATATVNVTVNAGPGSMVVAPYEVQTAAGQNVVFRADAWDQLGNRISVSPLWSASGGGGIDSNGLFSAATAGGPYLVTATSGTLSATGYVWVSGAAVPTPPVITTQPQNQSVPVGSNATFAVVANGTGPLSYQWLLNGGPIAGAAASSYTRVNVQAGDGGNYSVQITNAAGAVLSSNAVLTVIVPPAFATQPTDQTVVAGTNVTFSVSATGSAPLAYQWRWNGTNIAGATASSYSRVNVQPADAGSYSVRVTNAAGLILSSNAVLAVTAPPAIANQPQDQTVPVGSNATFVVVANGTAPLSYQWRWYATNLPGATASSYTRTSAQLADVGNYSVLVTNAAGSILSSNAVLAVVEPPVITTQPQNQSVPVGSNATFAVVANGTGPLSYQWLLNGGPIAGAAASSYTRTGAQLTDAGDYSVLVSNLAGLATSSNALLTVIEPPFLTTQPVSQSVAAGSNFNFAVVATGTAPFAYQWRLNGTNLPGANADVFAKSGAQLADAGSYTVIVSNLAGFVFSDAAILGVNGFPSLHPITDHTIHAGSTLVFTNGASDPDLSQVLTYSLLPEAPAGATLNSTNGVFAWTSALGDSGTTNSVTVKVTDDGTPSLSDAKSFAIRVVAPLTIQSIAVSNALITISWSAIPGRTYQVQAKDDLDGNPWNVLLPDVVATSPVANFTDAVPASRRLYRVVLLP